MLRCIPLFDEGRVDGAVVLLRDVSELRSRDRLLISKDATIKEIHHRVKNNLQTISSLLRLQGRRLSEPSAKTAIDESVRRIRSIALVHETLSREDGDEVDFDEIVRPLVRMVEEGLTSPERPLRFRITGDPGRLPSPAATSLAVVLTELLQNVIDHAYPPGSLAADEQADVSIQLVQRAGQLRLAIMRRRRRDGRRHGPRRVDQPGPVDRAGPGRGARRHHRVRDGHPERTSTRRDAHLARDPRGALTGAGRGTTSRRGRSSGRSVGPSGKVPADGVDLLRRQRRRLAAAGRPRRGGACDAPPRTCHPRRRSPGSCSSANSRHGSLASQVSHTALAEAIWSSADAGRADREEEIRVGVAAGRIDAPVVARQVQASARGQGHDSSVEWGTRRQPRPMLDVGREGVDGHDPQVSRRRRTARSGWELVNS